MDYKKDVLNTLYKSHERDLKELDKLNNLNKPSRGKNKKLEKQVVKAILKWCEAHKFDVDVIEASKFDRHKMVMVHDTKITPGYSDISGNTPCGLAVYIEAKAPKKRYNISDSQRAFLLRKIHSGAFACVIDNINHLHSLYHSWLDLKQGNLMSKEAKKLLLDALPTKRVKRPTKEVCELDFMD